MSERVSERVSEREREKEGKGGRTIWKMVDEDGDDDGDDCLELLLFKNSNHKNVSFYFLTHRSLVEVNCESSPFICFWLGSTYKAIFCVF